MWRLKKPFAIYIFLLLFLVPVNAFAEEFRVESGRSIQSAVEGAGNGDTILVSPGVYKENVRIDKEITIKGEEGAIIDGGGKGNVIIVTASNVVLEGLTIQNSGTGQEDSGIYIKKAHHNVIKNNTLKNVQNGIYIANSNENKLLGNHIASNESHFSERGNGIHMFKGGGHLLKENEIAKVQDGIYFDFTKGIKLRGNHISESRYGMHFMFSEDILAESNHVEKNVTGLMVMDSARIEFIENKVTDHFHFRGYGILIYETKEVLVEGNEILRNSTGLSLEYGVDTLINRNQIAANQVGLEFMGKNENNTFSENNFIGNVVQSKISGEDMRLDDGVKGNYWDDYSSFDLSGDGVGEEAYKAGSLYDRLLRKQPYWQFFFESPSIKLWTKAEALFPSFGSADVYDARPLIEPVTMRQETEQLSKERRIPGIIGILFILFSILVIVKGRKLR
ncbi:nitrous oxide reductase family maturation protein NosD [Mesobacillus subterraneus]|uniref:nitrous oxide reductase family maturation protein NosD n=1 Tax=Mesobacillus subterraneus TaxID=285983 RepID=UPI00203EBF94|nr:nitrous oxide reductase family maturation protein NosD [Mesobacillus subterraneus]MCM3573690.1 nitrous oxide reductase family maturation protein NosD [Mesobacillus subterraneus]